MTEEQIKNLKEGDKFTIEFTVKVNEVGNFLIAEAGGKAYVPEYGCVGLRAAKLVKKAVKDRYKVVKYGDEFQIIWADFHVAARFDKIIHPNAKAAAEAECARLNAEWRKKQEGGAE